ncbi:hypothetical protein JAAARDRAFT_30709 [Jaapia argillacea MUCL 33604]|uniref:BZIP domain-containing protein n=1 Tax=Jaapia argillacea MUCL 33604 TaxID=933084 RepID=A0A067QGZ8_9AGAM|nr:hypothetical protein JAAARDRAFT_30709 [Jaapia argillacea MUCL 33604]
MLSTTPEDQNVMGAEAAPTSASVNDAEAVQAIVDLLQGEKPPFAVQLLRSSLTRRNCGSVITASPEFSDLPSFGDFLTSPMDDSPLEDFLSTPLIDDDNMFTSPMVADSTGLFGDGPLFMDSFDKMPFDGPSLDAVSNTLKPAFDGLYTMSPATPSLDPTSLYPAPRHPSVQTHPASPSLLSSTNTARRNKSAPTGTRKNITPQALVPVDAPTQKRTYYGDSATSRKEVPAVFARKRARSQAFGDEEDQLDDQGTPLSMTEQEAIEHKRRQNTIAARRSRKRKLEYQRELEEAAEREKQEKEMWKSRALMMQSLLKAHGLESPVFDDT